MPHHAGYYDKSKNEAANDLPTSFLGGRVEGLGFRVDL